MNQSRMEIAQTLAGSGGGQVTEDKAHEAQEENVLGEILACVRGIEATLAKLTGGEQQPPEQAPQGDQNAVTQ